MKMEIQGEPCSFDDVCDPRQAYQLAKNGHLGSEMAYLASKYETWQSFGESDAYRAFLQKYRKEQARQAALDYEYAQVTTKRSPHRTHP